MIMCSINRDVRESVYYRHIPLISKTGFKAEFMGNELFHLVQLTALKKEGIKCGHRDLMVAGAHQVVHERPLQTHQVCPLVLCLWVGLGIWRSPFILCLASQVKKKTEGCLLTFQKECFCNGMLQNSFAVDSALYSLSKVIPMMGNSLALKSALFFVEFSKG